MVGPDLGQIALQRDQRSQHLPRLSVGFVGVCPPANLVQVVADAAQLRINSGSTRFTGTGFGFVLLDNRASPNSCRIRSARLKPLTAAKLCQASRSPGDTFT